MRPRYAPEPDRRTHLEFERAECYGIARYAGAAITVATLALILLSIV